MSSVSTPDLGVWKTAWNLLDSAEKRRARVMLGVVILAALSSAFMVVSIFPFLAVLADRDRIEQNSSLLWVYETFGFQSDYAFLVALGLGSFLAILLANLIQMLKTYLVLQFANRLTCSISLSLLERYLRSRYAYFLNTHTANLNKTILIESSQIVASFFRPASELIASTLTALAIVTVVIWVDPVIALVALLVLGGSYGVIFLWSRKLLDRLGAARIQHNGARFRIVGEALGGIKSMKITGREHQTLDRYHLPSLAMADVQVRANVISNLPQFVIQSVAFGGIIVVCLLLVDRARYEQGAALGELLPLIGVFAFAGQRILPELGKLYGSATKLAFGASIVRHVTQELSATRDLPPLPESIPPGLGLSRALRFEGVSYSYPNTTDRGLRDVSL
ncbi:ABC transporter transmembrane domain-containing protein, partial [Roseibaca sp. V10]